MDEETDRKASEVSRAFVGGKIGAALAIRRLVAIGYTQREAEIAVQALKTINPFLVGL